MKLSLITTIALSLSFAPISFAAEESNNAISTALAHPDRSESDREQDAERRTEDVLALAGIEPGMQIADLMAGSGWYSEVLARVTGQNGRVYIHNNSTSVGIFGDALSQRLAASGLSNYTSIVSELQAPGLPFEQLDAVFLVKFYHDTFWMGVDREAMNASIFDSLKPGGLFLVIDHNAEAGSEDRDTASDGLHRIDPELVKREVQAAGFEFELSSDLLSNEEDQRTLNIFDPAIRGQTDRFLLTFKKPE